MLPSQALIRASVVVDGVHVYQTLSCAGKSVSSSLPWWGSPASTVEETLEPVSDIGRPGPTACGEEKLSLGGGVSAESLRVKFPSPSKKLLREIL